MSAIKWEQDANVSTMRLEWLAVCRETGEVCSREDGMTFDETIELCFDLFFESDSKHIYEPCAFLECDSKTKPNYTYSHMVY